MDALYLTQALSRPKKSLQRQHNFTLGWSALEGFAREDPEKYNPETQASEREIEIMVQTMLLSVPPRKERLMRLYFGIQCQSLSVKKIAEMFECTPSNIQAMIKKTLEELKGPFRRKFRFHKK